MLEQKEEVIQRVVKAKEDYLNSSVTSAEVVAYIEELRNLVAEIADTPYKEALKEAI